MGITVLGCIAGCSAAEESGDSAGRGPGPPTLQPVSVEAAESTIHGVDADHDGNRDDVQRELYRKFPEEELERDAALALGRALQQALDATDSGNPAEIQQAVGAISSAIRGIHDHSELPTDTVGLVERLVVNTSERSLAYIEFNAAMSAGGAQGDTQP